MQDVHRGRIKLTHSEEESPPAGGKVVAPATKRGAFQTPAGRLYGFPTGESPVVKVLYKLAPSINLKAPSTTLSGIAAVKL